MHASIESAERMRWTGTIVLKASMPLLLAIAALTVVAGLSLPHLEFRSDESTWLAQDDPVYLTQV